MDFLRRLMENNTLEWMREHRQEYRAAAAQFEGLVEAVILGLTQAGEDLSHLKAGDLCFRLNRDTRFSKDKSPYRAAFRAHISPGGRAPVPVGFFLHAAPGELFLGGGLFAPQFTQATAMVRAHLAEHGEEFLEIVEAPAFREQFVLVGERLKNVPRGFDAGLPCSPYLKYKCWAVEYHVLDGALEDAEKFTRIAVEKFLLMRPFNGYLNRALKDFKMPER